MSVCSPQSRSVPTQSEGLALPRCSGSRGCLLGAEHRDPIPPPTTGIQTAQTAGDKFPAKRFPLENTVLSKTYLRDIIFDGEVLKDSFQLVSFK